MADSVFQLKEYCSTGAWPGDVMEFYVQNLSQSIGQRLYRPPKGRIDLEYFRAYTPQLHPVEYL
jgi:hypothetical protein